MCGSTPPGMTICWMASTIRAAPTECRLPGAPIAAILPPATPISAGSEPPGMTAMPPVPIRSSIAPLPELASPIVLIVFALATPDAQLRPQSGAGAVQFRMGVEGPLIAPPLEQCQLVRIERALEHLELLAARLFHAFLAARLIRLRELSTLPRCGSDRDNQSYRHFGPL